MSKELTKYGEPETWSRFSIVARHPLADQIELLATIGLAPSACVTCDFWWEVDGKLILICFSAGQAPSTTYFGEANSNRWRFYVRTEQPILTTTTCELAIAKLSCWMLENPDWAAAPSDKAVTIFTHDICSDGS